MRTTLSQLGVLLGLLACAGELQGRDLVITSFDDSGQIHWTSPSLNVTCRVEWAASPDGPWRSSWTHQQAIVIAEPSNQADVPMFYRIVCEVPDPHFTDISAEQSLALIVSREDDPEFVILDVRTASEFDGRHIIDAVNIDYYSITFVSELDALDKNKAYLLHCASGSRSGRAHDTMLESGFHEVYNMLGGIGAFQGVTGAGAYLEPF